MTNEENANKSKENVKKIISDKVDDFNRKKPTNTHEKIHGNTDTTNSTGPRNPNNKKEKK